MTRPRFTASLLACLLLAILVPTCPARAQQWGTWRTPASPPGSGGASTAADVTVLDVAGLYLATDVEDALAEVHQRAQSIVVPSDGTGAVATYSLTPTASLVRVTCNDAQGCELALTGSDGGPGQTLIVVNASEAPVTFTGDVIAGAISLDQYGAASFVASSGQWIQTAGGTALHASSHGQLGADPITITEAQVTDLESDLSGKATAGAATSSGLTLATSRLLGRTTANTGAIEEISVSSPLTLSAGTLGVGTIGVSGGGTGATTLAAHGPLIGAGTSAVTVGSPGTAGQVWTSNGVSADPTFQDAAGGVSDPLTIGTVITTTSLEPRGLAGTYADRTVQIGLDAHAGNNYSAWGSVAIGYDTDACAEGTTNSCLAVGTDAHATTNNTIAIGRQVTASALYGVVIGFSNAQAAAGSSIAIGDGPRAEGSLSIALGNNAMATGYGSAAIGVGASCAHTSSWCIGNSSESTAANQLILGGTEVDRTGREDYFKTVVIGGGVTNANPLFDVTLTTTGASGNNVASKDLILAGSKATGNAAGGAVVIKAADAGSSGTTLQSLTERARFPSAGGFQLADPGTKPACAVGTRGTVWYDAGGAGVADAIEVCGKSAADTYSWVALATF